MIALQFVENEKHSSTRYVTLSKSVKICKLNLSLNNTVRQCVAWDCRHLVNSLRNVLQVKVVEPSAKQLLCGRTSTWVSKSDQQEFMEKADPSSIVNDAKKLSTPLCDSEHQDNDEKNLGATVMRPLSSKPANIMAEITMTHCLSVFLALTSAIAMEVSRARQKLC